MFQTFLVRLVGQGFESLVDAVKSQILFDGFHGGTVRTEETVLLTSLFDDRISRLSYHTDRKAYEVTLSGAPDAGSLEAADS